MKVGSLFAGIGGFDLAAERAGLSVAWQVEVDPFACRVLSARFPGVRRYGDITAVDPGGLEPVDVVCGGWPCQGNSIAGKRAGHADERSGLFSEILRLIDGMDPRPRFLLLENVPGLLSVNHGRDFRSAIGELQGRGYVGCVRLLDAQHFGLAQRRKRLFFVCGLGAAGIAAVRAVLEGGERYPAPRVGARPELAADIAPSLRHGGGKGRGFNLDSEAGLVAHAVGTGGGRGLGRYDPNGETYAVGYPLLGKPNSSHDESLETYVVRTAQTGANGHGIAEGLTHTLDGRDLAVAGPVVAGYAKGAGNNDGRKGKPRNLVCSFVASPITASYGKQVDSSDTNAGPPNLIYDLIGDTDAGTYEADASSVLSTLRREVGAEAVAQWGSRILDPLQSPEVLRAWLHGTSIRCASDSFRRWVDDRPLPRKEDSAAFSVLRSVWENGPDGSSPQGRGLAKQLARQLGADLPQLPQQGAQRGSTVASSVRRLTPTEAERLQGFPDGWTCLCGRNEGRSWPEADACRCPDGPRYRALGNAVARPVAEWLCHRIAQAEALR